MTNPQMKSKKPSSTILCIGAVLIGSGVAACNLVDPQLGEGSFAPLAERASNRTRATETMR